MMLTASNHQKSLSYEPDRELDIHVLESRAYQRLKGHGLWDCGIVLQFYGVIEKFHPRQYLPYFLMPFS